MSSRIAKSSPCPRVGAYVCVWYGCTQNPWTFACYVSVPDGVRGATLPVFSFSTFISLRMRLIGYRYARLGPHSAAKHAYCVQRFRADQSHWPHEAHSRAALSCLNGARPQSDAHPRRIRLTSENVRWGRERPSSPRGSSYAGSLMSEPCGAEGCRRPQRASVHRGHPEPRRMEVLLE